MATWKSKDKTKPYYGKQVTTSPSRKIVEAGTSTKATTPTQSNKSSTSSTSSSQPKVGPDIWNVSTQPVSQSLSTGVSTVANPSPASVPTMPQGTNPLMSAQQPVSQSLSTGKSTAQNLSQLSVPSSPITPLSPAVGATSPAQEFEYRMATDPQFYADHSGSAAIVTSTDLGLFGAVPTVGALKLLGPMAVSASAQIGTSGVNALKKVSLDLASNNAAKAATTSALSKLGMAMGAAGTLVAVIGTYPFSGFIKEEALQTSSFGVTTALQNNDLQGALQALQQQKDMLNPGVWDKLLNAIPFANIVNTLTDFYEAAKIKVAIDEQVIKDKIVEQQNGETPEEFDQRVKDEEDDTYQKNIDYYTEQRKKLLQWEEEAADRDMKEDAKFWAEQQAKQRELEAKDRQAISDFWFNYRKRLQQISDDNRPSNLNFGLI